MKSGLSSVKHQEAGTPASSEPLGTQNLSFPDQENTSFQSCGRHFPAAWSWVSFSLSGCPFLLLSETDAEPTALLGGPSDRQHKALSDAAWHVIGAQYP